MYTTHSNKIFLLLALCALVACGDDAAGSNPPTSPSNTGSFEDSGFTDAGSDSAFDTETTENTDDTSVPNDTDLPDASDTSTEDITPEDIGDDTTDTDLPDIPLETCPEGWSELFETQPELTPNRALPGTLPRCASLQYRAVVSSGSSWNLSFSNLPVGSLVRVQQGPPSSASIASLNVFETNQPQNLSFTATLSGDLNILIQRPDGLLSPNISTLLACTSGCDLEATRYPIILVHGTAGSDSYLNLIDYFYGVKDDLKSLGYEVYTPRTLFVGHSFDRAAILNEYLDEVRAELGVERVHFIAHSQGGLDLRVLTSPQGFDRAEDIASITTIATPHRGIRANVLSILPGMDFSEDYLAGEFAEDWPESNADFPRFSWAAQTCSRFDSDCRDANNDEVMDLLLSVTYNAVRLLHRDDPWDGANDGLVPVASAIWGEVLGTLPADHFDQIGQIADRRRGPFDHIGFYRSEAQRLRDLERTIYTD